MHVRTSTDWPRARGSGRRTTRRKVSSGSPLGRVRISAGADIRPRSTTSFRSITATLMHRACWPDGRRPIARRHLWTPPGNVEERTPAVSGLVRAGVGVVRVIPDRRWVGLPEELSHFSLDLLVEASAEPVLVLRKRRDHLRGARLADG